MLAYPVYPSSDNPELANTLEDLERARQEIARLKEKTRDLREGETDALQELQVHADGLQVKLDAERLAHERALARSEELEARAAEMSAKMDDIESRHLEDLELMSSMQTTMARLRRTQEETSQALSAATEAREELENRLEVGGCFLWGGRAL